MTQTQTVNGHEIGFDRRRYGTTTYTWAHIIKPNGQWEVLGDPWPASRFPKAELEYRIDQYMKQAMIAAAHTDPYVLEQAYAQDEENEPMDTCRQCGHTLGIHEEGICLGCQQDRIDPTGDPIPCRNCKTIHNRYDIQADDGTLYCPTCGYEWTRQHEEEPADASDVTGWDQHGPSYE